MDTTTQKELKELYKKWLEVKRFLKSLGCSATDAEDLFQEGLLIYIRKKTLAEFTLESTPIAYVKSTCKFLWYNQSRKEAKQRTVELKDVSIEHSDDWLQKEMYLRQLEQAIQRIGEKCQELLRLFYSAGWNMSAIAAKIGLRNDKVAKAQKYRCLNKVKELIQEEQPVQTTHH